MQLTINGQPRDFSQQLTVSQLLEQLQLESERVVVELNRVILTQDLHADTLLNDGDCLEAIQFVGGG